MEETTNILPIITAITSTLCCYLAVRLRGVKRQREQAVSALINSNRAIIAMVEDAAAFERAKAAVQELKQLNAQLRRSEGAAP